MLLRRSSVLVLSGLACAVIAQAQSSSTSGAVRGVITSKGGKSLAGARIVLRNLETGFTRTQTAAAQGEYTCSLLPVGVYELTVSAPGMKTLKDNAVHVYLGQNATANFSLDSAEAGTTVEVVASKTALDTQQVSSTTAIDEQMVQAIPLNGRNFTDLVKLTPGAVTGDQGRQLMEGARGIMNNLTIDGASFNSNFYGEQRGSATIPFAFGLDTIRELQIVQDAYDPQYGDAAGGLINAVSKTGTNEFTGSALVQFRPSSMVAMIRPVPQPTSAVTNTAASRTRDFSQQQYNFNVGGPILKDKLFYFVGVETYHYSQDSVSAWGKDSSGAAWDATGGFKDFFGNLVVGADGHTVANENGLGYTNDKKNTVVFARLDWNINENHRFNFRVNTQKFTNENASFPGGIYGLSENYTDNLSSISWVGELTSILGPNLTNEARLQIATERRPRTPNSSASPELVVKSAVTTGQYWATPSNLNEFTKQFIDTATLSLGDLTLKGGVDMQWFSFQNQFPQYMAGYYEFSDYGTAVNWAKGTVPVKGGVTYKGAISPTNGWVDYDSSLLGGFLQAQYAGLLNHRLTLTGGLRVTRENQPTNPLPNAQFNGTDSANSTTSLDPRFGFTYDLTGKGRTLLRGGYGWFSSPNTSLTVSNTMTANGNTISVYSINASSAALATAWNSGVLSYANRATGGTHVTPLDAATLQSLGSASRTGQLWDSDNKLPRAKRMSLGLEHKLDNDLVLGVRVAYADFEHEQYFVNVNLGQKDTAGNVVAGAVYNDGYPTTVNSFTNSSRPGYAIIRGRRVDFTGYGDVFLSRNDGVGQYKALILTASRQSDNGFGFQSSLSFASSKDMNSNERVTNNGGSGGSVSNNPADPHANYASGDFDVKFRGVFAGYFPIYWGMRGMAMVTYQSGLPYSATTAQDLNTDGAYTDYAPGVGGRNAQRQPASKSSSLRFTRAWKIGPRFEIEGNVDIFNVLNWANFTTNQYSAIDKTGKPVATYGNLNTQDTSTREVQFGLRFRY